MSADTAAPMRLPRRRVRAGIAIAVALLATIAAPSAFAEDVPGAVTEEAPPPSVPPADVAPAPEADTTAPPASAPPPETQTPVADTPANPTTDEPVATPEVTAPTSPPVVEDEVIATEIPAADTTVTPLTTEGASGTGDAAPAVDPKGSTVAGPVAPAPAPPARETSQAPAEAVRAEAAPAAPAPPAAAVPVIRDWATTADGALASAFAPAGNATVMLDALPVFGVGSVSSRTAPSAVGAGGSAAWINPSWGSRGWTKQGSAAAVAAGWAGDVSWRPGLAVGPVAIGIERAGASAAGSARGDSGRSRVASVRADGKATREIRDVPLSAPREPANRVPAAAAGGSSAGAGAGGGGLALVAALLAVMVLVAPGLGRRLALEVPGWRQPLFVASLERPG